MKRHPDFQLIEVTSPWRPVPRVARVEFPAYGPDECVVFGSVEEARGFAKQWAADDHILVLVWEYASSMYVGRYDGRGDAGLCDGCGELSNTLKTVDGDNPYKVRDLCIICRCSDPGY
jgi:hypothetical protein